MVTDPERHSWALHQMANKPGFAQVLENLESPGILKFGFQAWKFCRGPYKSWNLDIQIYISNYKHIGIQSLHFFRNMGEFLRVRSS